MGTLRKHITTGKYRTVILMRRYYGCAFLIILISSMTMCIGDDNETTTLRVICAGSLVAPFEAIESVWDPMSD
ncbi:MAG: hypothetical protein ACXQS3_06720 [Candidatus Methanofastidiosia archaeon]